MTRPTDDELEAMAVRLDQSDANEYSYDNDKDEAAAMLRACKGRQSLPRMTPALGENIEAMRESGRNDPLWQQGDMQLMWVNEGDMANATFLAAIEPAPDHSDWSAAIEAAVAVATDWTLGPEEIAPALRALKKGPDHD